MSIELPARNKAGVSLRGVVQDVVDEGDRDDDCAGEVLVGDGEAPAREDGGLPVGEGGAQVEGPRLGQLMTSLSVEVDIKITSLPLIFLESALT